MVGPPLENYVTVCVEKGYCGCVHTVKLGTMLRLPIPDRVQLPCSSQGHSDTVLLYVCLRSFGAFDWVALLSVHDVFEATCRLRMFSVVMFSYMLVTVMFLGVHTVFPPFSTSHS